MARALRVEIPGGRYHVTARGNERTDIFWDDTDRFHFLELLAEVTDRFAVRTHAYVLMSNHYHILLETPEANLSLTMQWLNGNYGVTPLLVAHPPELKILWTETGNGAALYLNGDPWAFILEESHKGYSKGILRPATAHPHGTRIYFSERSVL